MGYSNLSVKQILRGVDRYHLDPPNKLNIMTKKQEMRKSAALGRLQSQLSSGVKTIKGSVSETVELTEKNRNRIENEISVLKRKLM